LNSKKINIAWYITIGIFIIHFLPYFLYPGDAYIRIHDTLEGEWIWLSTLNETKTALDFNPDTKIEQVMNGLPRSAMPTGLSMMMLLVKLFGTYWGYVINYFIVHLVGFGAMFLFLRTHIFKDDEFKHYAIYVSLIFSLIPVYAPFGLSVMSQPTLIHIFVLALKRQAKYYHWILLILFPLYSSIVWMGIPLLMFIALFWVYIAIRKRNLFPQYMLGMFILATSYALVNFNIFQLMFDPPPGFISHRKEYNLYMFNGPDIGTSILDLAHQFFTLHYHVGTMLTLPIFLLGMIVYKKGNMVLRNTFLVIVGIVVVQAFYNYFEYYVGDKVEIVKSFRLNRFNILLPVMWISGFALVIKEMYNTNVLRKVITVTIVCLTLTTMFGNDEMLNNYRRMFGMYHLPTFKEYMAKDQFEVIQKIIKDDPSTYRVACIGMNPSILQYNGFYTLDGLQSVYDLNYKHEFRKIFAEELEDKELRQYFDGWGNRCFIYSQKLGINWDAFMVGKFSGMSSTELLDLKTKEIQVKINADAFKNLGGRFIFSAVPLVNLIGFRKKMLVGSEKSFWNIHIYEIENE
jgi:hypothetical protein